MTSMTRTFAASALVLLLAAPAVVSASPQFGGPGMSSDGMGRMDSPEQKSMAAYSRGLKAKKKAEAATEPADKQKLYLKAKEELSKAAGYQPNYDAFLALGQVYLALGQRESALDACNHARSLKPNAEEARSCFEEAQKKPEPAEAQPAAGGGK
jgi:tetratricopeptide (TPR) repeat protein